MASRGESQANSETVASRGESQTNSETVASRGEISDFVISLAKHQPPNGDGPGADPGFPRKGATPKSGAPTYNLAIFCQTTA